MSQRRRIAVVVVSAALLAAMLLGCDRGREPQGDSRGAEPPCSCDGTPVVDPALLAFLSRARAAHHAADLAVEAGDRAAGLRALEGLIAAPRPAGPPPEVAEVVADAHARMAELRSEAGLFDEASRDVEAGLKLAPSPSHYQGHLLEVAGVVEERRAKVLEDRGDRGAAASARQRAVSFFEQAIAIQDQVITQALKDAREKPR